MATITRVTAVEEDFVDVQITAVEDIIAEIAIEADYEFRQHLDFLTNRELGDRIRAEFVVLGEALLNQEPGGVGTCATRITAYLAKIVESATR